MIKKTRKQKVQSALRRTKTQTITSPEKYSTRLRAADQFKGDAKKSLIIITFIIALEIILYFGTII